VALTPEQEKKRLARRHRREKRFRALTLGAPILAAVFLGYFLVDIVSKGYTAFYHAKVRVEVSYNQEVMDLPPLAVEEKYELLVSRGFLRHLPREMKENPDLVGTSRMRWVLADAEVDQYLKGRPNRLKPGQKELVERMRGQGRVKQTFNTTFFTNGDSRLPEVAGIKASVAGSLLVMAVTMLCAFPIGVLTSVYLEEFAPDNRLTQIIEVNINNLAAVPSILFGLLGLAIFINFFGVPRSSPLVGGLTLALLILPVIIISSRAALRAVPDYIRMAAHSVGATPWQVVSHHVLPQSLPGILTGSIIGLAEALGETAPLIIVGMIAFIPEAPEGILQASTVLPAQVYTWSTSSLRAFEERTAAGIIVLLVLLFTLNATAIYLRNKYHRRW
jgi:phosphate transport system permease protein